MENKTTLMHCCCEKLEKPLEIRSWFYTTSNRKWPMGIEWLGDRWRRVTWKVKSWPQYA